MGSPFYRISLCIWISNETPNYIMMYFELVKKGVTKLRRKNWPERDYISLTGSDYQSESGIPYWNNSDFKWTNIKLSISDFSAKDWQEEK